MKSPGPDGYSSGFFRSAWNIVKNDLVDAVQEFFLKNKMSKQCDICKAFDSISWEFIEQMLVIYKFPPQFIRWIMLCVTGSWFTININGGTHEYFKGKNGVRQGDPLSPFLFVLGMEILSRLLRGVHQNATFSFDPKCSALKLNHLVFADDLMLFSRGDVPSVLAITWALDLFSA